MIIQNSLHNRYNRSHSPKIFSWDGSNTTSKITSLDNSRSIRKSNDWTLACMVYYNGTPSLATVYSDYSVSSGIAIQLDSGLDPNQTYIKITDKAEGSSVFYETGNLLTNKWVTLIVSYNSTTNELTIYVNGSDLENNTVGNKNYIATSEWALGSEFGLYCFPGSFDSFAINGLYSVFCILNKQADSGFIESFNVFGEPDELSHDNVTFFTDLGRVSDKGTYNGLECSTRYYNQSSTTKEIRFVGFTDEQLGLDVEDNGISPNCLLRRFYEEDSPFELKNSIVVEKDSGFPIRRKGLEFQGVNQHYLKIPNIPQLNEDLGVTIISVIKEVNATNVAYSGRTIAWFSDESSVDTLIRILHRTASGNVIGFNNSTQSNSEIQIPFSKEESNKIVFKLSNETQTEPRGTFKQSGAVNEVKNLKQNQLIRDGASYDLYLGGVPSGVTFATEQYMDITFESFILVNGVVDDFDIDRIIHSNQVNNIPLDIQDKYDFELIIDFNNVYDDAGTLKIGDLSGKNHTILPESGGLLGWQTLTDLQNSQTEL